MGKQSRRKKIRHSNPDGATLDAVFWSYDNWSAEIIGKVVDFRVKYGVYPNSLTASKPTLDKFTRAASVGQMQEFTGNLDGHEDDGGLGVMDLSRVKRDFRQCSKYSVDEAIEYACRSFSLEGG